MVVQPVNLKYTVTAILANPHLPQKTNSYKPKAAIIAFFLSTPSNSSFFRQLFAIPAYCTITIHR